MVPESNVANAYNDRATRENIDTTTQQGQNSSPLSEITPNWMSCIRQKLESQGVTGEPLNIILASWRQGTQKQYTTYIKQWLSFCEKGSKNGFQPSLQDILEFLTAQSKRLGYSAVNTARSALSTFITIDGVKAGEHQLISRFMTGVFNQNPALPRFGETWDPQIVVSYLE